jgi:hypothetical protein
MPAKKKSSPSKEPTVEGIVGIGLDNTDGQKRITKTEEMVLVGGSAETHERMQETAIRFSEALEKVGKPLAKVPAKQAIDLLREAIEKSK